MKPFNEHDKNFLREVVFQIIFALSVIGVAIWLCSCATPNAGCTRIQPQGFAGYEVWSCPHPFAITRFAAEGCGAQTNRINTGAETPCGWTRGYTDSTLRVVKVWDRYEAETLEHERCHVQGRTNCD